jgi:hypothetical protein
MSYDLILCKKTSSDVKLEDIYNYIQAKVDKNFYVDGNRWIVEDGILETYFSFEALTEENCYSDDNYKVILSFSINYVRPDFFGQYAFKYIDMLVKDLDIYIHDPQFSKVRASSDVPFQPEPNELYKEWSELNKLYSHEISEQHNIGDKYPTDKLNYIYKHNSCVVDAINAIRIERYIPKIHMHKRMDNGKLFTVIVWTECVPIVVPTFDYIFMLKRYKRFFKTVEKSGIISVDTFNKLFGHLLRDFTYNGCEGRILDNNNVEAARKIFNAIRFEIETELLGQFSQKISYDKILDLYPNAQ